MLKISFLTFCMVGICIAAFELYVANQPYVCESKVEFVTVGNPKLFIDDALAKKMAEMIGNDSHVAMNYIFSDVRSPSIGFPFDINSLRKSITMEPSYSPVKNKLEMTGIVFSLHHPDKEYSMWLMKNVVEALLKLPSSHSEVTLELAQPLTVYCDGRKLP